MLFLRTDVLRKRCANEKGNRYEGTRKWNRQYATDGAIQIFGKSAEVLQIVANSLRDVSTDCF